MAFNIWTPKGQLAGLTGQSNPSVIYEAGAKILSGTVFKMWCTPNNGSGNLNYYESVDGLTSWTAHPSNPIGSGTGFNFPTVYHIGSTYYCYSGPETDQIYVRTSSDGITWGSATAAIPRGTAGAWDDTDIAQLNIVPNGPVGGLYYGYYEGIHTHSAEGLVTSPDLITWTKSGSNPIIDGMAPMALQYINGTYYMWAPYAYNVTMGGKGFNGLSRLSATAPQGPWTLLNYLAVPQNTLYCSLQADFDVAGTGSNTHGASLGDPNMLSALGNMYCYWTRTDNENQNQFGINVAIATGITPAQQVAGYEGMVGFPHPAPLFSAENNILASDNFTRANANPIGGNWTPIGTTGIFSTAQIVSNLAEPSTVSTNGDSFWNATSFPNDQWGQVVCNTAVSAYNGASVRATANNEYRCYWFGTASGLGSPGSWFLAKVVAGTASVLGSFLNFTVSQGDTITITISGTNILTYWNGYPVVGATDASLASGAAGFMLNPGAGAVTTSKISGWSGGGFVAAPAVPSSGTSAAVMRLRRKKRIYALS